MKPLEIKILEIIDEEYPYDYINAGREIENTEPRQLICYFFDKYCRTPQYKTAELIKRDRTTVSYSQRKVEDKMFGDRNYRRHVEYLENKIKEFYYQGL
jgi:chromosomal replication initiation ATPase DnaA